MVMAGASSALLALCAMASLHGSGAGREEERVAADFYQCTIKADVQNQDGAPFKLMVNWPVPEDKCNVECTLHGSGAGSRLITKFAEKFDSTFDGKNKCHCAIDGTEYVNYEVKSRRQQATCGENKARSKEDCWDEYKKALVTYVIPLGDISTSERNLELVNSGKFSIDPGSCQKTKCERESCPAIQLPQKLDWWTKDTRAEIRKVLVDGRDADSGTKRIVEALSDAEKEFITIDTNGDLNLDHEELAAHYGVDTDYIELILFTIHVDGSEISFQHFPAFNEELEKKKAEDERKRAEEEAAVAEDETPSAEDEQEPAHWEAKEIWCVRNGEPVDPAECTVSEDDAKKQLTDCMD